MAENGVVGANGLDEVNNDDPYRPRLTRRQVNVRFRYEGMDALMAVSSRTLGRRCSELRQVILVMAVADNVGDQDVLVMLVHMYLQWRRRLHDLLFVIPAPIEAIPPQNKNRLLETFNNEALSGLLRGWRRPELRQVIDLLQLPDTLNVEGSIRTRGAGDSCDVWGHVWKSACITGVLR
jgi:hypothetical protein